MKTNGGISMNEQMRVLELLDAGKINALEAESLLKALGKSPGLIRKETRDNVEEKLQRFAQDCGKFAKEVGCKVHVMYKGVEPKIKKATQAALEKAACVLEDVACSISESLEKAAENCCEDENCCCPEVEGCCEESAESCCGDEPKPN